MLIDDVNFENLVEFVDNFEVEENNISHEKQFGEFVAVIAFLGECDYDHKLPDEVLKIYRILKNAK